jgi:transcriptional regulator with XRE-family HTH domain
MTTLNNPNVDGYGKLLKQARVTAGLTQKQLADNLKISTVMIGRYELGAARPSEKTAFVIHHFFESSKSSTITTVDEHPQATPLAAHSLDTLLAEIRHRGFEVTIRSVS